MAAGPGPPILAALPESRDAFAYGEKVVGSFNTDDDTLIPVGTAIARPAEIATATGVTVCRSQTSGNFWACYDADDDPYEGSYLYEFNATTGATVRKAQVTSLVPLPAGQHIPKLAERHGYHALADLGCNKFLTVNRRTGEVIRLKLIKGATSTDYWKAVVDKIYRLTLTPADFAINADGTRIVYCPGDGSIRLWDLENDTFLKVLARLPDGASWPVWLQDGSIVVLTRWTGNDPNGAYLHDADLVRVDLAGKVTEIPPYDHALAEEGLLGMAASLKSATACDEPGAGKIYLYFDWDRGDEDEQPAILVYDFKTGTWGEVMPLQGLAYDEDLAAGFVSLENAGPNSDGFTTDTDPTNPGEQGPCPPVGPGGSSFDGSPDGDRVVQPGGFPATYVPPTGEGAVASADDPDDPQDLATLVTPLVSYDLKVCDGTVYRLAKSPLPRPGEPQMDARVLRAGAIPYPFADRFGSLPRQTFEVELADEDGFIRGLLAADSPNRFYKRWTCDVFIEDDRARLAGVPRQRLARGRCVTTRIGDQDQTLVLVFSDEYSRHDSPYSLDRELPLALIGDIFGAGASSPDLVTVPVASEDLSAHAATPILGEGSDEYRAAENPPVTPIGICQLLDLGDVLLGSETWRAYFAQAYACHRVPALFGSNLDPNCPASVRLDPELYNGDGETQFLVPGYPPWDAFFAHKYIEVTRNGVTYWVTLIFGRGPISDQHVLQKVPLSANIDGLEDVGDGTGDLIDDAASQLQLLVDIHLKQQTSGVWGAVASYTDGIAKIRTSDFAAVRAIHNARLSTRYRGAIMLDQRRAAKDWFADLCVSFDIRLGLNQHGQITAHTLDTLATLSGLRTFTDLHHIRDESFKLTTELNAELENSLEFDGGPEPASGRVTVPKQTLPAPDSIRDWGDTYAAQPITFVGLHRPDVAGNVAAHRLIATQDGITRGVFDVDLAGGSLRGGELVRLTHFAGIGQTGWRNRVLLVTDRQLLIDDEFFRTEVNWEDKHPALVRSGTDDESAFGFNPLRSEADDDAWILGSEITGTAYRLG